MLSCSWAWGHQRRRTTTQTVAALTTPAQAPTACTAPDGPSMRYPASAMPGANSQGIGLNRITVAMWRANRDVAMGCHAHTRVGQLPV